MVGDEVGNRGGTGVGLGTVGSDSISEKRADDIDAENSDEV